jgi:ABC-type uncharacterized transport system permease subunit
MTDKGNICWCLKILVNFNNVISTIITTLIFVVFEIMCVETPLKEIIRQRKEKKVRRTARDSASSPF